MLVYAIVGHLVGDYLLQNDWMAQNKKKASFPCAVHCLLWTMAVTVLAGWWVWWVPPVLFVTHFIQDRTTVINWWMRFNRQSGFASPPLAPWSIIVVDNVWHILTLALIAKGLGQ
jgi:hypothetical protein